MALDLLKFLIAGTVFGASLTIAGVFQPSVVIKQMKLESFDMLRTFLVASVTTTLVLRFLSQNAGYTITPPEPSKPFLLNLWDANFVGGFLTGIGMALAGTCPGTSLVQIGLGIVNIYVIFGCITGGLLSWNYRQDIEALRGQRNQWMQLQLCGYCGSNVGLVEGDAQPSRHEMMAKLIRSDRLPNENGNKCGSFIENHAIKCGFPNVKPDFFPRTVSDYYQVSEKQALLIYLEICITMLAFVGLPRVILGHGGEIRPYVGGLCIGLAQISNVLLTASPLGISVAWEHLGGHIRYLSVRIFNIRSADQSQKCRLRPAMSRIVMAFGAILGSWTLAHYLPDLIGEHTLQMQQPDIGRAKAFIGGVLIVFGSRLAGGCPSGHGISGMAMMSTASLITLRAMFGGGAATGLFMRAFLTLN